MSSTEKINERALAKYHSAVRASRYSRYLSKTNTTTVILNIKAVATIRTS
jgi:hypothetical protein